LDEVQDITVQIANAELARPIERIVDLLNEFDPAPLEGFIQLVGFIRV